MLLFVPPSSFEGCGENPYDKITLSQLLAGLIVNVSFGALTSRAAVNPQSSQVRGINWRDRACRREVTGRNHYSLLATIEDGFGLPRLANAKSAATLFDLLPDFGEKRAARRSGHED